MVMSIAPDKVKQTGKVSKSGKNKPKILESSFVGSLGWNAKDMGDSGVIGDPSGATSLEGSALLDHVSTRISKGIKSAKKSW
jgi:creatinine amidohydrolase/Fe(II)-dependent formamide hydrolase-like protein